MANGSCSLSACVVPRYCHACQRHKRTQMNDIWTLQINDAFFTSKSWYLNSTYWNNINSKDLNPSFHMMQINNQTKSSVLFFVLVQYYEYVHTLASCGFFWTAASNSSTAFGMSPCFNLSNPSLNGSGCSFRGLSSSNL